jgi:hypothetical protein
MKCCILLDNTAISERVKDPSFLISRYGFVFGKPSYFVMVPMDFSTVNRLS